MSDHELSRRSSHASMDREEMMRVLIVCGSYPKVSETFITGHIQGLAELGHEVTVLARGTLDLPAAQQLHSKHPVRFWDAQPDSRLASWRKLLRRGLHAIARPVSALRAVRCGSLKDCLQLSYLHACELLGRDIKEHGPFDIAHAHFGVHGIWMLRLNEVLRYAKSRIVTFHGFDVWSVPESIFEQYAWMRSRQASFTANSFYTQQRLLDLGFEQDTICIWRMGLRSALLDELFTHPLPTPAPDGRIRIISCGRLAPVKGHDDLIRAVVQVARESETRIELKIIGGGSKDAHNQLSSIIEQEEAYDYIELLGSQPNARVHELMRQADLFALTSKEDPHGAREAFGVVFLEASANGLPILTTRSGGIPEAVLDGHTGLLAEENNVADIANTLRTLIARRNEWPRFGENGREYVNEHFSTKRTLARLLKLYEHTLGY